jgi:glycerophosphoryl diester phosphodiesterase
VTTLLEGQWGSEPLSDYEKYIGRAGQTHDAISLNLGLPVGNASIFQNLIFGWSQIRKQMEPYLSLTQSQNIQTVAWTVNDVEKINEIKSWNVDFLLTDLLDQGGLRK